MPQRQAYIDATAIVHENARIGVGTNIWNWTKVRENAEIGEGTNIGQCCYVDIGVRIGSRCKIQNGASIYMGVTVEDDVFVGPNVAFTNDRFPRSHDPDWEVSTTLVQHGASIGANATIVCGTTLGQHCIVAAGSVVTSDVPAFALVMGVPARIVDYVTVSGKRLHCDPRDGAPNESQVMDKILPSGSTP